ncbi:MAG: hypothetical protein ACD_75C00067G0001 [uncultured bacterium]|nr:MAG: hypothetical protein ACD_75C00067G0001 [uncultured bacterium]
MTGREITPMATTEAPTTPVDAASMVPTNTVLTAIPPLTRPNKVPIASSSFSASCDLCRTMPMKMKRGMAIRMVLFMIE